MKVKMILVALVASRLAASAQDDSAAMSKHPGGGRMAACRDDMQKFCADKMGPDRRACMTANKDKLSDGCKSAIAAIQAARAQKGQ